MGDGAPPLIREQDVVLVTCYEVYRRLLPYIPDTARVIVADTTFQLAGLHRLHGVQAGLFI